jgi:hypothetical protein
MCLSAAATRNRLNWRKRQRELAERPVLLLLTSSSNPTSCDRLTPVDEFDSANKVDSKIKSAAAAVTA